MPAALNAKVQEIEGLHSVVASLQQQLQTATPQQKPAIIDEIEATNVEINQAEAELPALEAALKACLSDPHVGTHISSEVLLFDRC